MQIKYHASCVKKDGSIALISSALSKDFKNRTMQFSHNLLKKLPKKT